MQRFFRPFAYKSDEATMRLLRLPAERPGINASKQFKVQS
jgi:hypothetical protein